jgi:hypothetical protein
MGRREERLQARPDRRGRGRFGVPLLGDECLLSIALMVLAAANQRTKGGSMQNRFRENLLENRGGIVRCVQIGVRGFILHVAAIR